MFFESDGFTLRLVETWLLILTELMALLGAVKKMMRTLDLGLVSGAAIARSEELLYVAGRVGVYDPSLHAGSQW